MWNFTSCKQIRSFLTNEYKCYNIYTTKMSTDLRYIVSSGDIENIILVWNVDSGN